jgi:hypothetical protein
MSELIKSISIQALLIERDRAHKALEDLLTIYNSFQGSNFIEFDKVAFGSKRYRDIGMFRLSDRYPKGAINSAKDRLNAMLWKRLMDESGMKTFMSAPKVEEWDKLVREEDQHKNLPPLTEESIKATFEALHCDKDKMFKHSVINVFNNLSWCHKSNQPQKFGKRIIIANIGSHFGNTAQDRINDLEKAMRVLNQQKVKDYRQGAGTIIHSTWMYKDRQATLEFDMFTAKLFKNSNCHITFKSPGLVELLNGLIATAYPNALPPIKYKK